jgi:hypothetical protein
MSQSSRETAHVLQARGHVGLSHMGIYSYDVCLSLEAANFTSLWYQCGKLPAVRFVSSLQFKDGQVPPEIRCPSEVIRA